MYRNWRSREMRKKDIPNSMSRGVEAETGKENQDVLLGQWKRVEQGAWRAVVAERQEPGWGQLWTSGHTWHQVSCQLSVQRPHCCKVPWERTHFCLLVPGHKNSPETADLDFLLLPVGSPRDLKAQAQRPLHPVGVVEYLGLVLVALASSVLLFKSEDGPQKSGKK